MGLVSRQTGRFELPPAGVALRGYLRPGCRSGGSARAFPDNRPAHESWCSARRGSGRSLDHRLLAAPTACWWARTKVLSIKSSSKTASPASSANTACHACARDHLVMAVDHYRSTLEREYPCLESLQLWTSGGATKSLTTTAIQSLRLWFVLRHNASRSLARRCHQN